MTKNEILSTLKKYSEKRNRENDYGYLGGVLNSDGTFGKVALRHFKETRSFKKNGSVYLFPDNSFLSVFYLLKGLGIAAPNFKSSTPNEVLGEGGKKSSAYLKLNAASFDKIKTLFN